MDVSASSLLQAMTQKMRWSQQRQQVLAENIANADTPGYVERDLAPFSFADAVGSVASVTTALTDPRHISAGGGDTGGFAAADAPPFEITPSGNAVSIEDEMMKVSSNDIDYQTVTALYTRSLRLIRIALGQST